MNEHDIQSRAAPAGVKYESMAELMQNEGTPKQIQERVIQIASERRIATRMAQLRHQAGITQKDMAQQLGVKQSTISKLEAEKDGNITLNEVKEYARITGERITLGFGRPLSHMEAVAMLTDQLKFRLDALAKIANQDIATQGEIKYSLGDALINLAKVLTLCSQQIPVESDDGIAEIRMEFVTCKKVAQKDTPAIRSSAVTA